MNNKTLFGLTAVGSLIIAGSASAGFLGMSWDMTTGANGDTYRVYADVDAGDQVDAVFGDDVNSLLIETSSGNAFYQNAFGTHSSMGQNPVFIGLFPSLAFDSYITIGATLSTGNALLDIGISFTGFEAGGAITTSNGSWFATPADAQVFEVGGRVLIGQFTVAVGDGVHGIINMQGKDAGLNNWQARAVEFKTGIIPAPGALALLGVAGLAVRRRRK